MEAKKFRCRHCKKLKWIRVEGQQYCGDRSCQQARRNEWRRRKYAEDLDYRLNQQASTEAWLDSQGGSAQYHREYRQKRKARRAMPSAKDKGTSASLVKNRGFETDIWAQNKRANRDAKIEDFSLKTGRYVISSTGANRDAYLVDIRLVSNG